MNVEFQPTKYFIFCPRKPICRQKRVNVVSVEGKQVVAKTSISIVLPAF